MYEMYPDHGHVLHSFQSVSVNKFATCQCCCSFRVSRLVAKGFFLPDGVVSGSMIGRSGARGRVMIICGMRSTILSSVSCQCLVGLQGKLRDHHPCLSSVDGMAFLGQL